MTRRAVTSPRARDLIIRRLHERRHELQGRWKLTLGEQEELRDVLAKIDRHELLEREEQSGPYRRERNRELRNAIDGLRKFMTAEEQERIDRVMDDMDIADLPPPATTEKGKTE